MQDDTFQMISKDKEAISLIETEPETLSFIEQPQTLDQKHFLAQISLNRYSQSLAQVQFELQFLIDSVKELFLTGSLEDQDFDDLNFNEERETSFENIESCSKIVQKLQLSKCKTKYASFLQLLTEKSHQIQSKEYLIQNLQKQIKSILERLEAQHNESDNCAHQNQVKTLKEQMDKMSEIIKVKEQENETFINLNQSLRLQIRQMQTEKQETMKNMEATMQKQLTQIQCKYIQFKENSQQNQSTLQNSIEQKQFQIGKLQEKIAEYEKAIQKQGEHLTRLSIENTNINRMLMEMAEQKDALVKTNSRLSSKIQELDELIIVSRNSKTQSRKTTRATMTMTSDSDSASGSRSKGGKSYLIRTTIDEYVKQLKKNLQSMGGMTGLQVNSIIVSEMNSISNFTLAISKQLGQ